MHRFTFLPQLFSGGFGWTLNGSSADSVTGITATLAGTSDNDVVSVKGAGSFTFTYENGGGIDTFIWTNGSNSGSTLLGDDFGTTVTVGYAGSGAYIINERIASIGSSIFDPGSYVFGSENDRVGIDSTLVSLSGVAISTDGGRDYVGFGPVNRFIVDTGDDNDTIFGNSILGSSSINTGNGNDSIYLFDGIRNTIDGGDGNDTIYAAGSYSSIFGNDGDDYFTVLSNTFMTTVDGGDGNDSYAVGLNANNVLIKGGDDSDYFSFIGNASSLSVMGENGADVLSITGTNSSILANMGADNDFVSIASSNSSMTVDGGTGSDTIFSDANQSSIFGGTDDDIIQVGTDHLSIDHMTVDGGTGNDSILFQSNYGLGGEYGTESSISGGEGNDTIIAAATKFLTINGGEGNNVIEVSGTLGSAVVSAQYMSIVTGGGNDTILTENVKNSTVFSGAGNDVVSLYGAGSGNVDAANNAASLDVQTGDGDDQIFVDTHSTQLTLDAGKGNDLIDLISGNQVTIHGNDNDDSILVNASVTGAEIYGDAGDDIISLTSGRYATLDGGTGDDTIFNGAGSILIFGGHGDDSIVTSGDYATIDASNGDDIIYSTGDHTSLDAGAGDDFVNISGSNLIIFAGTGDDQIRVAVSAPASNVLVDAGGDADSIYIGAETTNISVQGNSGNDTIENHADSALIFGGEYIGSMSLEAFGEVGSDSTGSGTGSSVIGSGSDAGSDVLFGSYGEPLEDSLISSGDDYITSDADNVTIIAGAGNDIISVSGNDLLVFAGDDRDNIDLGQSDNASIFAGTGDDTINAVSADNATIRAEEGNDYLNLESGDSIVAFAGEGNDTIENSASNASIFAGDGNNEVDSDAQASDVLISTEGGDDKIDNRSNNSTVTTGLGDDTISNNSNNTTIDAGEGSNFISNLGTDVTIIAGEGNDTLELRRTENSIIDLGDGDNVIYPNANDAVLQTSITAGAGDDSVVLTSLGSSTLNTGDGSDFVKAEGNSDEIDLGSGNDSMEVWGNNMTVDGGDGNDSILVVGESIAANTSDGIILQYNVDGNSIDAGSGDDVIDFFVPTQGIVMGSGSDTTLGSGFEMPSGNTTVAGGTGNDTIYAHDDFDMIQYADGDDHDIIFGFNGSVDMINITKGTLGSVYRDFGSDGSTYENLVLQVGSGDMTLVGAADMDISIMGEDGSIFTTGSDIGSADHSGSGSGSGSDTGSDGSNTGSGSGSDTGSDGSNTGSGSNDGSNTGSDGSNTGSGSTDGSNTGSDGSNTGSGSTDGSNTGSDGSNTGSGSTDGSNTGSDGSNTGSGSNGSEIDNPDESVEGSGLGFSVASASIESDWNETGSKFVFIGSDGIVSLEDSTIAGTEFDADLGINASNSSGSVNVNTATGSGYNFIFGAGSIAKNWTVSMGSANDTVQIQNVTGGTFDAGSGDDFFSVGSAVAGDITISTGDGSDLIYAQSANVTNPNFQHTITVSDYGSNDVILIDATIDQITNDFFDGQNFLNYTDSVSAADDSIYSRQVIVVDNQSSIGSTEVSSINVATYGSDSVIGSDPSTLIWITGSDSSTINISDAGSGILFTGTNGSVGDSITGGSEDDLVHIGTNDTVTTGDGNDTVYVSGSANVVFDSTESGTDVILGWDSTDVIIMPTMIGSMYIDGSSNDIVLQDGSETMSIIGSFDNSTNIGYVITGSTGSDNESGVLRIATDNEVVYGSEVTFYGGDLDDGTLIVQGSENANIDLSGSLFENLANIDAGSADSELTLTGDVNDNVIIAGQTSNTLQGGGGNDTLIGGAGSDVFYYAQDDSVNNVTVSSGGSEDGLDLTEWNVSQVSGHYQITGSQVVFALGSNQTLTVLGNSVTQITITGSDGNPEEFIIDYGSGTIGSLTPGSGLDNGSSGSSSAGSRYISGDPADSFVQPDNSDIPRSLIGTESIGSGLAVNEIGFEVNNAPTLTGSVATTGLNYVHINTATEITDIEPTLATGDTFDGTISIQASNHAAAFRGNEEENYNLTFAGTTKIGTWYASVNGGADRLHITNVKAGSMSGGGNNDYFHITTSLAGNITLTGGSDADVYYAMADSVATSSNQYKIYVSDPDYNAGDVLLIDAGVENLTSDFFGNGQFYNYANAEEASTSGLLAQTVFDGNRALSNSGMKFSMVHMASKPDVTLTNDNEVDEDLIKSVVWTNSNAATINFSQTQDDEVIMFTNTNNRGDLVSLGGDYDDTITAGASDSINAGDGNDSITVDGKQALINGGDGNDTIIANNATRIVYDDSSGDDIVLNWNTETSSADILQIESKPVNSSINSDGQLVLESDNQTMTISKGSGTFDSNTDIAYNYSGSQGIAHIADSDHTLEYTKGVTYYNGVSNGTLNIATSHVTTVDLSTSAYDNIARIDASDASGRLNLGGDSSDNYIIAGKSGTTLWGGGGNDTLVGGDGTDHFIYRSSEGNVVVMNGTSNDVVDLSEWSYDALSSNFNFTNNGVILSVDDNSSLNVIGTSMTQFKFSDGTYTANYSDNTFSRQ